MPTGTTAFSTLIQTARDYWYDAQDTKSNRVIKLAVNDTLKFLNRQKNWPHLWASTKINLPVYYNTGTVRIAKDAATVAGSGTTFSSTHAGWNIWINGQWPDYRILSARSTTALFFDSGYSWGQPTASAASYILYKERHALPTNADMLYTVQADLTGRPLEPGTRDSYLRYKRSGLAAGELRYYYSDRQYLYVWPYPSRNQTLEVLIRKKYRDLVNDTDTVDGLWDDSLVDALNAGVRLTIDFMMHKMKYEEWARALRDLAEEAFMRIGDIDGLPPTKQAAYGDSSGSGGPDWLPVSLDNLVT